MLAVILSEDEDFFRTLWRRLRLGRFSVIRYRDPIKLSDNLEELSPDLIVVKVSDYPLHWQVLASQAHYALPHHTISFALYASPDLPPPSFPHTEKIFWFSENTSDDNADVNLEIALNKFSNFLSSIAKTSTKTQGLDTPENRGVSFPKPATKSRLMAAVERREGFSST
jgi:hypothetical protein